MDVGVGRDRLGLADAQDSLGVFYDNGLGVTQDHFEAANWFAKAAEQGLANAQNNLGLCFEYGRGVESSRSTALAWYRKAAAQGHEGAKTNLQRLESERGSTR